MLTKFEKIRRVAKCLFADVDASLNAERYIFYGILSNSVESLSQKVLHSAIRKVQLYFHLNSMEKFKFKLKSLMFCVETAKFAHETFLRKVSFFFLFFYR